MAYTEKYFVSFCNPLGQSCRVSILQDGFLGVPTELIGQADPIKISYDNNDDFKFKPIIESEATIALVFDDDTLSFSELWTSNERTFKVDYLIDSVLEWSGFIVPEGFDYNLKGGKYPAVLTARDGLSTLEGILFKTEDNQFYGTQDFGYNNKDSFPFILILTEILRKLDLGIDLWTLVDYYEQSMNLLNENSRNSDPLAISYVSVKTYINDTDREDIAYFEDVNEAWDCKKIIENICNIWGARIYQQNGVWRFKSIHADSAIANPYNTENDPFVGENPTNSGIGTLFKYECYYSVNETIDFENTQFILGYYNTIGLNDSAFNADFTAPATEGFYLIKGLNRVVQINSGGIVVNVKTYESAVSDYYWKKYNNTTGYLGRELADSVTVIPCSNKDIFLKDNDAEIRMDQVYKQFRVNFDYTFVRVGDSPINLLQNGNFALPFTQYGQLEAPPSWERNRESTDKWFPRGRVLTLPSGEVSTTGGNTNSLEMHIQFGGANTPNTDPNPAVWASFVQTGITLDQKVKILNLRGWCKYRYQDSGSDKAIYYPVFKAILVPTNPVVLDNQTEVYLLVNSVHEDYDLEWLSVKIPSVDFTFSDIFKNKALRKFFNTYPSMGTKFVESEKTAVKWYDFNLRVQATPKIGNISFQIHGLCSDHGKVSNSFPSFSVKVLDPATVITDKKTIDKNLPTVSNMGAVPRPQFTGLEFAYVPDPDVEVPKTDYIFANGDVNYTFQEDPIRIYNGDTTDPEIVSGIYVPTNTQGRNKWDAFNNAFGKTDIGMILCKSIMQQYYKPNRLLDCEFKADNFKYGDIISFEAIPNVKFIMLRGAFNSKRGYWENCTLAQITNDAVQAGGIINNDTLDPKWQETGNTRCVKDENGLNTGEAEQEIQDINSNSESFGDLRWQSLGENLTSCPIGLPSKYFWGTDIDIYDVVNFKDYNIVFVDDSIGQIQVSYNNTGDKYIYFLHLASLGSVVQISNAYQSQIISSFTYLADVTINGYLYRVLRQNFFTSEFEDLLLTYYIQ